MKYDLEERTALLGESVIKLCKEIELNHINRPLIDQLLRCSTSVGANYAEADDAQSPRDFRHKIAICKKESRESKHFIRMLIVAEPKFEEDLKGLWNEAKELNLIFNSIFRKLKKPI